MISQAITPSLLKATHVILVVKYVVYSERFLMSVSSGSNHISDEEFWEIYSQMLEDDNAPSDNTESESEKDDSEAGRSSHS